MPPRDAAHPPAMRRHPIRGCEAGLLAQVSGSSRTRRSSRMRLLRRCSLWALGPVGRAHNIIAHSRALIEGRKGYAPLGCQRQRQWYSANLRVCIEINLHV